MKSVSSKVSIKGWCKKLGNKAGMDDAIVMTFETSQSTGTYFTWSIVINRAFAYLSPHIYQSCLSTTPIYTPSFEICLRLFTTRNVNAVLSGYVFHVYQDKCCMIKGMTKGSYYFLLMSSWYMHAFDIALHIISCTTFMGTIAKMS